MLWLEGETIVVEATEHGRPVRFTWQSRSFTVSAVCNRWRVSEEWWRSDPAAWREYIKIDTAEGVLCVVSHDLATDRWWLIRVFD